MQAAALDAQELESAEEALKLSQELDDKEEEEESERERADLELARSLLEADERTAEDCSKDELLAQQVESQLKKEMVRVAKLERRQRQLAEKKLCHGDMAMAEQLAAEIMEEEARLRADETADRRLASALIKGEQHVLKALPQVSAEARPQQKALLPRGPHSLAALTPLDLTPLDLTSPRLTSPRLTFPSYQTEETLRALSSQINGDAPVPLRSKLRGKLNSLMKGLSETTKGTAAHEQVADKENCMKHRAVVVAQPREPLTHQW